jgi:hypothetical protein
MTLSHKQERTMEKRLFLTCEEGPTPRAKGFLEKRLFGDKAAPEAQARHGEVWCLVLGDKEVRLLDDSDREVATFPRERAEAVIRLPFTQWDPQAIVNVGILVEPGTYFWFAPDKAAVREIRRYRDQTFLLQHGATAYARILWTSLSALVGSPMLILGGFICVRALNKTFRPDSPATFVTVLIPFLLGGFASFAFGVRSLTRLVRLRAVRREMASSATNFKGNAGPRE